MGTHAALQLAPGGELLLHQALAFAVRWLPLQQLECIAIEPRLALGSQLLG